MTAAEALLLVIALVAPAFAALATARSGPVEPRRWAQAGSTVAAGAWLSLLVADAQGPWAGFHVDPLIAAGGCGAALVTVAAAEGLGARRHVLAIGAAFVPVGLGLAAGRGPGTVPAAMAAALAFAAAAAVLAAPRSDRAPLALLAAGASVCAAAGAVDLRAGDGKWAVPGLGPGGRLVATGSLDRAVLVALLVAAALAVAAGAVGRSRAGAVLLAAGLALGLPVAPARPGGAVVTAVLLGLALVSAARDRAALGLGLLSLAAATGPSAMTPASLLLGAAAVVVIALDRPGALLAALPAAVSLVAGANDDRGALAVILAVAAGLVGLLLARSATAAHRPLATDALTDLSAITPGAVPAGAVGAWLVLAPGTWGWTRASLTAYDRGAARALAAALVAVVARLLLDRPDLRLPVGGAARPWAGGRRLVSSWRSASNPRARRAARSQRPRPGARPAARRWPPRRRPRWPRRQGPWPGRPAPP